MRVCRSIKASTYDSNCSACVRAAGLQCCNARVPCLAGEWAAKLQRYTSVQQKRVTPNPKRSDAPAVAVRTEGEAVLKALVPAVCSMVYAVRV